MTSSPRPLDVALIGTGPWASNVLAPLLAAGPETRLACVWSRRPEAAAELAAAHGAPVAESFEDALARCEALAFAVPPDVQAALATRAARAGRHLMLEKPLALNVADAETLARAVDESGVTTQLMLTHRYRAETVAFLAEARALEVLGARLAFLSGAFVRGPYACAWRKEHGALHDLGPHALDLLEAALGPIEELTGRGDPRGWVSLVCRHAGGAVSEVALTGVMQRPQSVFRLDLHTRERDLSFDAVAVAAAGDPPWARVRAAFAEAVRERRPSALDVHRGVELQRLIERALRALA
jgi:predicted dehydrogenase